MSFKIFSSQLDLPNNKPDEERSEAAPACQLEQLGTMGPLYSFARLRLDGVATGQKTTDDDTRQCKDHDVR